MQSLTLCRRDSATPTEVWSLIALTLVELEVRQSAIGLLELGTPKSVNHWMAPSLGSKSTLRTNDTYHVLIRDYMRQSYPLWNMSCTRTPHKRILEALFQCPMDLIAYVFDARVVPHNERFLEDRVYTFPVDASSVPR